jgi:hypothetical protein
MKAETLLPLGKLDPGLKRPESALDMGTVGSDAQCVDRLGYHALLMEETKDDPFQRGDVSRNRIRSKPICHRHGGVDVTKDLGWAVRTGTRIAGEGPHAAALRDALASTRAVDARLCSCCAGHLA